MPEVRIELISNGPQAYWAKHYTMQGSLKTNSILDLSQQCKNFTSSYDWTRYTKEMNMQKLLAITTGCPLSICI